MKTDMTILTQRQLDRLKRDTAMYRNFKEMISTPVETELNGQRVKVMPNKTGVMTALMKKYGICSMGTVYNIIKRMEEQERGAAV